MEEAMREMTEELQVPDEAEEPELEDPDGRMEMPDKHGDVLRLDDTEEDVYDGEDEEAYMGRR